MPSVGQKILAYLNRKQIDLDDLAKQIELEPNFLKKELEAGTMEIKTLEKLSKELRIPLYSFFSTLPFESVEGKKLFEIPYYVERLDPEEKNELNSLIVALTSEISLLKQTLAEKEKEIERLQAKLNLTDKNQKS